MLSPDELRELADTWYEETGHFSMWWHVAEHPAYQKILAEGASIMPFALNELANKHGHWYAALRELTGENPVPEDEAGFVPKMTARWLQWGIDNGYFSS